MTHKLILELPEDTYAQLVKTAQLTGSAPEQLAVEWLATVGSRTASDPIETLIGGFPSNVPGWPDDHDKHIGQALMRDPVGGDGTGAEMGEIFADTSGWGHLLDPTQSFHSMAASLYRTARRLNQRVITTNYFLVELVALLTNPLRIPRPRTVAILDGLKRSPFVEIVHVDPSLDADAWRLLQSRQDKEWSLVDCASFVVMSRRRMREALTTDHHFEQAGLVRLLK